MKARLRRSDLACIVGILGVEGRRVIALEAFVDGGWSMAGGFDVLLSVSRSIKTGLCRAFPDPQQESSEAHQAATHKEQRGKLANTSIGKDGLFGGLLGAG